MLVVQNKESQDFSEAADLFLVTLCAQLSGVIAHAHAVGNIDVFRKPSNLPAYKTFQGVSGSGGIALGRCSDSLSASRSCCSPLTVKRMTLAETWSYYDTP